MRRDHAKLVDAAQQFEAMMLQEMLKPMHLGENSWGTARRRGMTVAMDTMSAALGPRRWRRRLRRAVGWGLRGRLFEQVTMEHEKNSKKGSVGTKVWRR